MFYIIDKQFLKDWDKMELVNQKERELYCVYCKTITRSNKTQIRCEKCSHILVTVVYNSAGQRLTGNVTVAK